MSDVAWSDPQWLQFFSLNVHNALEYFARSSFYDFNCNNEIIRQKGLQLNRLPTLPPGIEYVLHDSQEPHLFVIHKRRRESPKNTTSMGFYYILDGRVYQAPTLHATVLSRMTRCLFNIRAAFNRIQTDIDPLQSLQTGLEPQRDEAAQQAAGSQPRQTQEDKERARQIDGIIHSVLQAHMKAAPVHTGSQALPPSNEPTQTRGSSLSEGGTEDSVKKEKLRQ